MTAPNKTLPLHDLIAGGVAGSAGIVVGHPLDSIKVRMQNSGGISSSIIQHQRGSVWAGIGAPLAMASVINASIFLTYGGTTRLWDDYYRNDTTMRTSFARNAVCGGLAGIISSLVLCPVDNVKIRLQTNSYNSNGGGASSFQMAKNILAKNGIKCLYRGFGVTIGRQGPGFVVYFSIYDSVRASIISSWGNDRQLLSSIVAGGIAGSLGWAIVYPLDFIKTRIQSLPLSCRMEER